MCEDLSFCVCFFFKLSGKMVINHPPGGKWWFSLFSHFFLGTFLGTLLLAVWGVSGPCINTLQANSCTICLDPEPRTMSGGSLDATSTRSKDQKFHDPNPAKRSPGVTGPHFV